MNLIQVAPSWLLVVLALLLVAAAVEDAMRLRVSNVTCLGVLIAAAIAMAWAGFPPALWQNALVFAVLLIAGTLLFGAGKIGGGDVKLLATLGLWVNIAGAIWLLASVLIAGGVLAILFVGTRLLRGRPSRLRDKKRGGGIPYALAITAGAAFVFASQIGAFSAKPEKPNPFAVRPLGNSA
jgi:prepilin peptidase CpaA